VLLAELAGADLYEAPLPTLLRMVELLVGLQADWPNRIGGLLDLGLPDWRGHTFPALAEQAIGQSAPDLDDDTREGLAQLASGLPARFEALASCGVPDTLVHGDFHPGNVRSATAEPEPDTDADLRLYDWGDSGVGHPMFDQAAFLQRMSEADRVVTRARWSELWRQAVPGSDPDRAATLLSPVSALRQAVTYQLFLDNIEPAERVYHHTDPQAWLVRAAQRFAQERSTT
jgi:Ser/Thr protein kinase RdoA (MazF antagonist)